MVKISKTKHITRKGVVKKNPKKKVSFIDILENPKSRRLVEEIEGLEGHHDYSLGVTYRNKLIKKLKDDFGYKYVD